MIRPFSCICLLMAAGSGLYLYQSKHQAQMLDREIVKTMKMSDVARQRSGLLRAEYALLNDPARLADLSHSLLPSLQETAPGQFSTFADLDRRLPAVGAPPAAPAPLEPDVPVAELPKPALVATAEAPELKTQHERPEVARQEIAHADAPHPEPVRLAVAPPHPAAIAAPATPVAQAASPRPALAAGRGPSLLAASTQAVTPQATARSQAPRPVVLAASRTEPAPRPPEIAPPMQRSAPAFASALGMARTMVPMPTPVSAVYAAGPQGSSP